MTIFRASTGLQRDNALNLDFFAAPLQADLVGEGEDLFDPVVAKFKDLKSLLCIEAYALLEDFRAGEFENVRHGKPPGLEQT